VSIFAAVYCRQSIEKEDSCSLDVQEQRCIALAQSMGWETRVYKDPGKSGKDMDRPSFQKMLKDIEKGKVSTVIVYKLDRISRNLRDFFNLMEEFRELEVGFRSITENFDTTTSIGRVILGVLAVFAQFERETIAERVRDNMHERARMGIWNGGPVPMGFEVQRKIINGKNLPALIQKQEDIEIIKEIFKTYLRPDMTTAKIARTKNRVGEKTLKGNRWSINLVRRTLENPVYCAADKEAYEYFTNLDAEITSPKEDFNSQFGIIAYNRRKLTGKRYKTRDTKDWIIAIGNHKPVVTGKEFALVQNKIKERSVVPPRKGTGTRSILGGLVRCGKCGQAMIASYSKNKKSDENYKYVYFRCIGRRVALCDAKGIRTDLLEKIVIELIEKIARDPAFREKQIETAQNELNDSGEKSLSETKKLKRNLEGFDREENNLIAALGKGTIKPELIERRLIEIEKEKKQTKSRLLELENKIQQNSVQQLSLDVVVSCLEKFKDCFNELTEEEKKSLLRCLIEKVTVEENKVTVMIYAGCTLETDGHRFVSKTQTMLFITDIPKPELPPENTLGHRLTRLRILKGLTIKDAAKAIKTSETLMSRWERDMVKPTFLVLNRLSNFYEVPLEYFYKCKHDGDKLRILRVSKNLRQCDLADLLNVSRDTITQWEMGRRKVPKCIIKDILALR